MERQFIIKNQLGLHARSSARLVQISQPFQAGLFIRFDGQEVDGKSILDLLTLACPFGSEITVRTEGDQAEALMEAVGTLIEDKFGEE